MLVSDMAGSVSRYFWCLYQTFEDLCPATSVLDFKAGKEALSCRHLVFVPLWHLGINYFFLCFFICAETPYPRRLLAQQRLHLTQGRSCFCQSLPSSSGLCRGSSPCAEQWPLPGAPEAQGEPSPAPGCQSLQGGWAGSAPGMSCGSCWEKLRGAAAAPIGSWVWVGVCRAPGGHLLQLRCCRAARSLPGIPGNLAFSGNTCISEG